MFRFISTIVVVLCLTAGGMARERNSPGVEAWFVDSLVKVFHNDARGTHSLSSPEFRAARNQHISVQLAVRSDRPIANLSAEVKTLKSGRRHRITNVEVHHVGYVQVRSHTPDSPPDELVGTAPGLFPDPLEDFPFDLEAKSTVPIWVTIHVPADAAPGIYKGTIVVHSRQHVVARNPFSLQVVNASVPQPSSLKYTNWFELDDKTSRQFYGVAAFSPEWWTLVANVAHVFAAYRQNVVITPLRMLIQPRAESGTLAYDFTNFDRWVETFQQAGAVGYIEGSHLVDRQGGYDGPMIVPTIQIVEGQPQAMSLPPDDPRVETYLSGFLAALNAHLKDRGWDKIYFQHVLDEAHGKEPPYYARIAALVHRQMPGIPTLDAVDAAQMPQEIQSNCDVWVPQLGRFDDQMPLLNQRLASGHPVWYYTCLFPQKRYINRLMDLPLLKARLLPWLDFRYGFTGFLHWGGNYWTPDPMKDAQPVIENNTQVLPPGDAFIFYPDRARLTFRSSIRLEAMRSGMEDYEMLMALKARDAAAADKLAASAITSFTEYVRDVQTFRSLEQELLDALSRSPSHGGGQ